MSMSSWSTNENSQSQMSWQGDSNMMPPLLPSSAAGADMSQNPWADKRMPPWSGGGSTDMMPPAPWNPALMPSPQPPQNSWSASIPPLPPSQNLWNGGMMSDMQMPNPWMPGPHGMPGDVPTGPWSGQVPSSDFSPGCWPQSGMPPVPGQFGSWMNNSTMPGGPSTDPVTPTDTKPMVPTPTNLPPVPEWPPDELNGASTSAEMSSTKPEQPKKPLVEPKPEPTVTSSDRMSGGTVTIADGKSDLKTNDDCKKSTEDEKENSAEDTKTGTGEDGNSGTAAATAPAPPTTIDKKEAEKISYDWVIVAFLHYSYSFFSLKKIVFIFSNAYSMNVV